MLVLNRARYQLKEAVDSTVDAIVEKAAKKRFADLEKNGVLKSAGEGFVFPKELVLSRLSREPFRNHAYDLVDYLNGEEVEFAKKIDNLPNVAWWLRNPTDGGFYLTGWKRGRFFPDFLVKTKDGAIFVFEYKGKQLEGSEYTEYKKGLGEKWAKFSGGVCRFLWVEKESINKALEVLAEA